MAVPVPGIGKKSYLQSVREAVWGTDLACTARYRIKSANNTTKPQLTAPGALQDTMVGPVPVLTRHDCMLEVVTEFDYADHLRLIDLAMGTATYGSTGGSTSGGGPYVHAFVQKQLLNSHTFELGTADIPTGKCEQFNGMKVASWELSGGEGKPLIELSMSFIGKLLTLNATPTAALTSNSSTLARWADLSSFDDGSGDTDKGILKSFSLKVDNKVPFREQGSLYTAEPLRDDYADVSLELESEFSSRALLAKYLAATTASDVTLTFAPSVANGLVIRMPVGYLEPWGRPIETRGIVRQRFTWRACEEGSSTDTGLQLDITCSTSTI